MQGHLAAGKLQSLEISISDILKSVFQLPGSTCGLMTTVRNFLLVIGKFAICTGDPYATK